jgi:hypothetical protein
MSMTAIIAARRMSGATLIAADSRISWDPPNGPVFDTLQKIYQISPDVVVALSGDVEPARKLLSSVRNSLKKKPEKRAQSWIRMRVSLVLASLFALRRHSGHYRLTLFIFVKNGNDSHVVKWSTESERRDGERNSWKIPRLGKGAVWIDGSIRKDRAFANSLRTDLEKTNLLAKPSDDQWVALVQDILNRKLSGDKGAHVGVGGLFQICILDPEEGFCFSGFQARQITAGSGIVYSVQLAWCPTTMQMYQIDDVRGVSQPLTSLDDHDFGRPSGSKAFRYGRI